MHVTVGAPPTYMSSVGNQDIIMPQQQQQPPMAPAVSQQAGYYGAGAMGPLPPSVYDAGDTIPPVKI